MHLLTSYIEKLYYTTIYYLLIIMTKETRYGLMPIGEEIRRYRLTKDTFGGKKGDIVEIRDEPIDGSYWMDNITSGGSVQPFVDFDAIEPHGWEINSYLPEKEWSNDEEHNAGLCIGNGGKWVRSHTKTINGAKVHVKGYCKRDSFGHRLH